MVFEKVAKMLAEQFGVDESTITMKTSFEEDLGADSLDIVELTMMIEEEFDLGEIEDGDLEVLKTVGDVVELITSRNQED
ncbi:MAG: acyl carrier protein [Eubacteriales bacterium]|jgi:acyl carrier protein